MDKHYLPSGRAVSTSKNADPNRPWELQESGGLYLVRRQRRGDLSEYEVFAGGRTAPMHFSRQDAEALAAILNARAGARAVGRAPPSWK